LRASEITSARIFKSDSPVCDRANPSVLLPVLEIFVCCYSIRQIGVYLLAKVLENRLLINNNKGSETGEVSIEVVEYKGQLPEFIVLSTIV
jgi:hypothetical protein